MSLNLKLAKCIMFTLLCKLFHRKRECQKNVAELISGLESSYGLYVLFRNQTASDHIKPQTEAASVMPGDINAYLFVS